jgi:hypothetical protein
MRFNILWLILACTTLMSSKPICALEQKINVEERIRIAKIANTSLSEMPVDLIFMRFRTRFDYKLSFSENLVFGLRITNEARKYFKPENKEYPAGNEILIENLYMDLKKNGWSLSIGKKTYMLNRGFLIMEGSPLDGSRTCNIDGIWISKERNCPMNPEQKAHPTLMFLWAPKEDIPKPFNYKDSPTPLVESDQWAVGFTCGCSSTNMLFLYREAQPVNGDGLSSLYTFDVTSNNKFSNWETYSEAAIQFGKSHNQNHLAYALWLSGKLPNFILSPELGFVSLSGDSDVNDDKWNGWDPLFARWPMFSEYYIYPLAAEEGVAFWTDMTGPYLKLTLGSKPVSLLLNSYYWLERGANLQAQLKWEFTKYISGHLLADYFIPGTYYSDKVEDGYMLRSEFLFKY